MNETHEALDHGELKKMKKTLRSYYFTAGMIGVMIFFILQYFLFVGDFNLPILYMELAGFLVFVGLIALTRFLCRNLRRDIKGGFKIVREYIIEKKDSFEDNDPGLGGRGAKYCFLSESRRFFVEKTVFETANIGDFLIEHTAPNSQEELKIEIRTR